MISIKPGVNVFNHFSHLIRSDDCMNTQFINGTKKLVVFCVFADHLYLVTGWNWIPMLCSSICDFWQSCSKMLASCKSMWGFEKQYYIFGCKWGATTRIRGAPDGESWVELRGTKKKLEKRRIRHTRVRPAPNLDKGVVTMVSKYLYDRCSTKQGGGWECRLMNSSNNRVAGAVVRICALPSHDEKCRMCFMEHEMEYRSTNPNWGEYGAPIPVEQNWKERNWLSKKREVCQSRLTSAISDWGAPILAKLSCKRVSSGPQMGVDKCGSFSSNIYHSGWAKCTLIFSLRNHHCVVLSHWNIQTVYNE